MRLRTSLKKKIEFARLKYEKVMASRVFKDPLKDINDNYLKIDTYIKNMEHSINVKYKDKKTKWLELVAKLDALSPLKTLTRGYCLAEANGKIIKTSKELTKGDNIDLKFSDGTKNAEII